MRCSTERRNTSFASPQQGSSTVGWPLPSSGSISTRMGKRAGKLLPVEAGLLHAQARPQGDDQIGLLQQDVAVAHTPMLGRPK